MDVTACCELYDIILRKYDVAVTFFMTKIWCCVAIAVWYHNDSMIILGTIIYHDKSIYHLPKSIMAFSIVKNAICEYCKNVILTYCFKI